MTSTARLRIWDGTSSSGRFSRSLWVPAKGFLQQDKSKVRRKSPLTLPSPPKGGEGF
jgi:hypothetical protein